MFGLEKKNDLPAAEEALAGRALAINVAPLHLVTGNAVHEPFPAHLSCALFGMGCFWGVEQLFWQQEGVYATSAGYAGGFTPNPTYREVCTGMTGHNEVVRVLFDESRVSYLQLLNLFWESHDPTQGMRQGPDRGTQYRSAIYAYSDDQMAHALSSKAIFQQTLAIQGFSEITTEILLAPTFYFAEDEHQQYLHKNPGGYCDVRGTGLSCAIDFASAVRGSA